MLSDRPSLVVDGLADLLILSAAEAAALRPLSAHLPSALVVVTAGIDGSTASGIDVDGMHVAAPTLDAPATDTTGAGDAYAAVLIELAHLGTWSPPPAELERAMTSASELGAAVSRVDGAQGRVGGEVGESR